MDLKDYRPDLSSRGGKPPLFGDGLGQFLKFLRPVFELLPFRLFARQFTPSQFVELAFQLNDLPTQRGRFTGGCRRDFYGQPLSLIFQIPACLNHRRRQSRNFLLQLRRFRISRVVLGNPQHGRVTRVVGILRCIKEGERLVILVVMNRIVRMRVALHAIHRQSIEH